MKKILIIFGGNSYEYLISCKSAKTILENIDRKKYDITTVGITTDNHWYIFNDDPNMLTNDTWLNGNISHIDTLIPFLKSFDKVFPIMHGNPLENGNLQGMFNLFNIPYVGSGLLPSIISYDKDITKIICTHNNIPMIPSITILKNQDIKNIPFEYPVIIKPAKCGSSIGINIAKNNKELKEYLKEAFLYDDKILIEKYIKSRELECAILDGKKRKVSPIGEIKSSNIIYDYEAKYNKESTLTIPANIPKNLSEQIQKLSLKIFDILSLKDLARIDFLYDYNHQKLYFNEVNTMPGFTSSSMYPKLLKELKIPLKELITKLIELN